MGSRYLRAALRAAFVLCLASMFPPDAAPSQARPNVVIFIGDDLSYFDVGAYGNQVVRTPNVDRLAREGMRFDRAFTLTAMCTPSRSVLYTGLGPHRNGAHMNHGPAREGVRSLPHYLRPLAYRVALAGKRHIKPVDVFPFEYLEQDSIAGFLQRRGESPFLLIVGSRDPHGPHESGGFDPEEVPVPASWVDTPETRRLIADYYTDVESMDREIGVVLDLLQKESLLDSTAFVFAGDHGYGAFAKWTAYDAGLRVPFIVRWPGRVAAGSTTEAMIDFTDVLPTLVEAAGGHPPAGLDGRSFLPVLLGERDRHRDVTFGAHTNRGIFSGLAFPIRSVRTERYQYIRNLNPGGSAQNAITHGRTYDPADGDEFWLSWVERAETDPWAAERVRALLHRPAEELYDLEADPWQLRNLAADPGHQDVVANLSARLDDWMAAQGDRGMDAEMEVPRREAQAPSPPRLHVSADGRFLVTPDGEPFFPTGDTAWRLADVLAREEVAHYLDRRREQGFNTVTFIAFPWELKPNRYGDEPFARVDGRWDPARPITTPGSDPRDPAEYDHWDHLDYVLEAATERGFQTVLLPSWGSWTVGAYAGNDTSGTLFPPENAYRYGRFIGQRYRDRPNLVWMLGGDRSPIAADRDLRPVFRAMAEGIADGVNGVDAFDQRADYATTLMSYHPPKIHPNSSEWFHDDPWLDFNSIQAWPEDQIAAVTRDYQLRPVKPTWLFEGRYEDYDRAGYAAEDWGEWQARYQAYQTVFSGGFGHVYGHERIFGYEPQWVERMEDPGARDMRHLDRLLATLTPRQRLSRVPAMEIVQTNPGRSDRLSSNRQAAMRGEDGTWAMVYLANGRELGLHLDRLAAPALDAYWFDPRTGRWRVGETTFDEPRPFRVGIPAGPGAPPHRFDPPGERANGNDWVLVLRPDRPPQ